MPIISFWRVPPELANHLDAQNKPGTVAQTREDFCLDLDFSVSHYFSIFVI
jgi:hypothetical protein